MFAATEDYGHLGDLALRLLLEDFTFLTEEMDWR